VGQEEAIDTSVIASLHFVSSNARTKVAVRKHTSRTCPTHKESLVRRERTSSGSPSPGSTILSPSPSRDILFQNAFDLSDRFWIRH
jgi:hypothetical protein